MTVFEFSKRLSRLHYIATLTRVWNADYEDLDRARRRVPGRGSLENL